jgi:hypothetical protein
LDGLVTTSEDPKSERGFKIDFFKGLKGEASVSPVVHTDVLDSTKVRFNDTIPANLDIANFSATSTAYYRPDEDGVYQFGLAVVGRGKLYVNDKLVRSYSHDHW